MGGNEFRSGEEGGRILQLPRGVARVGKRGGGFGDEALEKKVQSTRGRGE